MFFWKLIFYGFNTAKIYCTLNFSNESIGLFIQVSLFVSMIESEKRLEREKTMMKRRYKHVIFMVWMSCVSITTIFAKDFQTGDIIFQTSKSAQSIVIQKATHSPYSHMGMIVHKNHQIYVLEAIQPVKYTPLKQWIQRGVNQAYVVKRYYKPLSNQQQQRLVQSAEQHLAKPYDLYFGWGNDAIYCSEIVWKAYREALNIQLAPLQRLKQFDLSAPQVKKLMKQRYGSKIPLNETVIAPEAIFRSKLLEVVH